MTAIPLSAKLCQKCGENYVGRLCPKCTPKKDFFRAPLSEANALACADVAEMKPAKPRSLEAPKLTLRLVGQVRGGKNAMGVTKTGKHYARPAFKKWRAEMAAQIRGQLPPYAPIVEPSEIRIDYVAGDGKRRDQTGIFDALFHLLEHTRIILDDSLLWVTESTRRYDKANPGVTITFL